MNNASAPGLNWRQKLFVAVQYFLPQHALTRVVGWLMQRQTVWLKNLTINLFCRGFSVNTAEAGETVPDDYATMNAFFTRELRPGARPIAEDAQLVSPCDGVISQCGVIEDGQIIQAKGFRYSVADLLADEAAATRFAGGQFMTIYLAPYDYHRVHMPADARLRAERHVPGALFSVNGATAAAVPRLFARNERRTFELLTPLGEIGLVMVGALNVGSITTVWESRSLPAGSADDIVALNCPTGRFVQGDTLGWFNMGSTVILLLPAGCNRWRDDCQPGDSLRMGQALLVSE